MAPRVGGAFPTTSRNVSLALFVPSLTVTVMIAFPVWLVAGATLTVRLAPEPPKTILAFGTSVGFEEEPLTAKLPGAVSASFTVKAIGPVAPSSGMNWSGMLEMVGGWFWPGLFAHLPAAPAL